MKWKGDPEFNEELRTNTANTIFPHVPDNSQVDGPVGKRLEGSAPSAKAAELLFKTAGMLKNVSEDKNTTDKPKEIDRNAIKRRIDELRANQEEEKSPH